jgi:hypothetical protein
MLSGVDCFPGEAAISLLYQIVHDAPALERPPEVTDEVEAVIRRGLAKDKWQRFEGVLTFARAFESAVADGRTEPAARADADTDADAPVAPARERHDPPAPAASYELPALRGDSDRRPRQIRVVPVGFGGERLPAGMDAGAMTMKGFAASRPTAERPATHHVEPPRQAHEPAFRPPARVAPRPAPARPAPQTRPAPVRPAPLPQRPAPQPQRPSPQPQRPAPQPRAEDRHRAAPPRSEPQPRQGTNLRMALQRPAEPDRADSLLMEPFFDAYPEDNGGNGNANRRPTYSGDNRGGRSAHFRARVLRGDTLQVDADEMFDRPPRHGWKVILFLITLAASTFAAALAVGWRPPLVWRQTALYRELGLPGAASPALPGSPSAPENAPSPALPAVGIGVQQ